MVTVFQKPSEESISRRKELLVVLNAVVRSSKMKTKI